MSAVLINAGGFYTRADIEGAVATIRGEIVTAHQRKRAAVAFRHLQNMLADAGLVQALCETLLDHPGQDVVEALQYVCQENKDVCVCVIAQEGVLSKLIALASATVEDDFSLEAELLLQERALRAINAIAGSLPSTHDQLGRAMFSKLVMILERDDGPVAARIQAMNLICTLAAGADPDQRARLAPAVPVARQVAAAVGDTSLSLLSMVATIAMANMMCEAKRDCRSLLEGLELPRVLPRAKEALQAGLEGRDYPANSGCFFCANSIVHGLSALASDQLQHPLLIDCGLIPVLHLAADTLGPQSPRLLNSARLMLTQLTSSTDATSVRAFHAHARMPQLLADVVTTVCERNESIQRLKVLDMVEQNEFDSPSAPCPLTIREYVERIKTYSGCTNECYLMAPVLIGRLEKAYGHALLNRTTVHRIVLCAIMLAAKTHDDEYLNNKCWARIGGFSVQELNVMELVFLMKLNFNAAVHPSEYEECRKALECFARGGQVVPAMSALSMTMGDKGKRAGCLVPWPGCVEEPHQDHDGATAGEGVAPQAFVVCLAR